LTNLDEGWLVANLTESEARAIFAVLSPVARLSIRVWSDGWPTWLPLDAPECAFIHVLRLQTQNPPVIQQPTEQTEITQVFVPKAPLPEVNVVPAPTANRRHRRFDVQIQVVVQTAGTRFETETLDVSEGGIRLRDPLPEQLAGYCQVVFSPASGPTLSVLASPVEDQRGSRVHLEFVDTTEQWKFIEWMRTQDWAKTAS
jgi:hypothetical protein